jgi:hypothetical protein
MKEIKLTQGQVALVDDEDYEKLSSYKWYANKRGSTYYAMRNSKSKPRTVIYMHRFVLGLKERDVLCDHKDLNGLNNQKYNLRTATHSENLCNRNSRKNSSSKYLGVSLSKNKNKWRCHVVKNGSTAYLGYFENEIDAALAYNEAAQKVHGEFTNLNILQHENV